MTERCPRCGAELKTVEVKVPVYHEVQPGFIEGYHFKVIARYETREEVADCVRCTGSY